MMIPRVGQSVVVSYINGDIEQPLVTGRIFNSVEQVPYKLPDNKTKTAIRSQTHKGTGYNEISMEDLNKKEEIFIKAQNDLNSLIQNHQSELIGGNHAFQVNKSQIVNIGLGAIHTIGGSYTINVGCSENIFSTMSSLALNNDSLKKVGYLFEAATLLDSDSGSFKVASNGPMLLQTANYISLHSVGAQFYYSNSSIRLTSHNETMITGEKGIFLRSGGNFNLFSNHHITIGMPNGNIIQMSDDGIELISKSKIKIKSESIDLIASTEIKLNSPKIKLN